MKPEPHISKAIDPEATGFAGALAKTFVRADDELFAWLQSLPDAPTLPSADEEDHELEARIEADLAAGETYPHSLVREWLKTFGQPDYKPFFEWLKSAG